MKTIQKINGATTITKVDVIKATKVFNMTRFNYGIHEVQYNNGTLTLTFDSMPDAQKFVTLYNEL